ncbi:MAG: hypothetical protein A2Y21_09110 [Clostridiales bacterium GWC2_40_7]|nr:MAG: hypothetical protein A2Y21_09110 [Clostridiales bacterium GWC2_40_7]
MEENISDYDLYYPQFVGSKESLLSLKQKDVATLSGWDTSHPLLSNISDADRIDYFDVAYGSDPLQMLDVHHLKSGRKLKPVIFYIHGGGWNSGDKNFSRFFGPSFLPMGYTLVSVNYRLIPKNPYPAQIEDCAAALKWVVDNMEKYGGDPFRIAVIGDSAGGHLAGLLVAGQKWHQSFGIDINRVKCWVPISGDHDLGLKENYYGKMMQDMAEMFDFEKNKADASPVNHVTGREPPSLIIHGGDDWLVPKTNSLVMYDKLKGKGAQTELQVVEGYMHCNMTTEFGNMGHKPTEIISNYLNRYIPALP